MDGSATNVDQCEPLGKVARHSLALPSVLDYHAVLHYSVTFAGRRGRERAGHRQGDHEHGDDERGRVGAPVGEGGHGHGDGGHEEGNECPGGQELGYVEPVVAQVVDRIAGGEQEAEEQEDLTRVGQDERKAQKS